MVAIFMNFYQRLLESIWWKIFWLTIFGHGMKVKCTYLYNDESHCYSYIYACIMICSSKLLNRNNVHSMLAKYCSSLLSFLLLMNLNKLHSLQTFPRLVATICILTQNFIAIGWRVPARVIANYRFLIWRPSAILDLLYACARRPTMCPWWYLCHCKKIGSNQFCSFG